MKRLLIPVILLLAACHSTEKEQREVFKNEQLIKYNIRWISDVDRELQQDRELVASYAKIKEVMLPDTSGLYYEGRIGQIMRTKDSLFRVNDSLLRVNDSLSKIIGVNN